MLRVSGVMSPRSGLPGLRLNENWSRWRESRPLSDAPKAPVSTISTSPRLKKGNERDRKHAASVPPRAWLVLGTCLHAGARRLSDPFDEKNEHPCLALAEVAAGFLQRTFRCFAGTPPGGSLSSVIVCKWVLAIHATRGFDSWKTTRQWRSGGRANGGSLCLA